ncbi:helix-turn-helix domain-containing protein [Blastococcus sp. SYSU D00820]
MTGPLVLRPGLTLLPRRGPLTEALVPPAGEHRVFVNVGRPYRLVETLGDTCAATPGRPGDVAVVPAGTPFAVRSADGTPQDVATLVVAAAPEVLAELADAAGARAPAELLPVAGARSPDVAALAGLLSRGLADRSDLGRLAVESLGLALVAALARDHGAGRPPPPPPARGLSRAQLARVLRHVEEGLAGPLPVAELAAVAHVSEFHFSRQFRAATGTSPHRYVLDRRVERARELLTGSARPVSAVAAACGFADASHLTRVLRRATGRTPAALRDAAG